MKKLIELRNLDLKIEEVSSSIKYFKKNNIDWDVYLPSKGINLQRSFVWDLNQKRELIWSVLIGRHIPHMAFINIIIGNDNKYIDVYQIIDGKQRFSTIIDFTEDKFTILIEGREYLFSELPLDYQRGIDNFYFRYYLLNENFEDRITDEQKIRWFKFINFAGTPQDIEHMNKLK